MASERAIMAFKLAEECKGCDGHNHPLEGVKDNGKPVIPTMVISCKFCGEYIDFTKQKLVPVENVRCGETVVEFQVVSKPPKFRRTVSTNSVPHFTKKRKMP